MPPRGRGGKFSKPTRGGGKHFSRDLQPLDKDGNPLGMWRDPAEKAESSSEEEESSSEEESSEDDAGPSTAAGATELTREQRKELAKKKKAAAIARKQKKVAAPGDMPTDSEEEEESDEGDLPANPNHTSKAREMARAATGPSGEEAPPAKKKGDENLSRREREAIAAQQAKERYQKLHAEGKTDEAKADLARLKLIREQREQAAARKQAEKEEADERQKQNKEKLDKEEKKRADALGAGAKKPLKAKK